MFIMICFLTSCSTNKGDSKINDRNNLINTTQANDDSDALEGYLINNLPISSGDRSYSLENLRSFFENDGEYSSKYLDEINAQFPITHLRRTEITVGADVIRSYYIVYPVAEGGKYIIFLYTHLIDIESNTQRMMSADVMYVNDLPKESDFSVIDYGSAYADVLRIAPHATVVNHVRSTGSCSYSLLDNGKVLYFKYERDQNIGLIVCEKQTLLLEETFFAKMIPSDLQP